VLYGDLDGDGNEEIVVASRKRVVPPGAFLPQQFLDVFGFDGSSYVRVFAATEGAPPGHGAPDQMIATPRPVAVSQQIDFLELVDFRRDRSPEVAVGILTIGAAAGPLDVWVVSADRGWRTELFEATQSDGRLAVVGNRLLLDTGSYAPSDPQCCPSRIEHQVIGFDRATGRITILRRTFTPAT